MWNDARQNSGSDMDIQELADIDEMIREEKRLSAVESQSEIWAEGLSDGIEPEILAEAALSTAFGELLRRSNEEAAIALLERMREKIIAGDFDIRRSHH